ncbi:MAG: PorP/SprF family type IX secretion system membrane protein [Bacteroidota bacterium]
MLCCLLTITFVCKSNGQDIHFTQFYMHPLTINPALAGDYKGGLRASFINRRQWGQLGRPLETFGASLEQKIWLNGDYLILGGLFLNDRSVQIGYVNTKAYFSTAYEKNVSRHSISLGVQVGMSSTDLDPEQTFPAQFNATTGSFDPGLSNDENVLIFNGSYLDINVGIFWRTIYRDRMRFKTGISASHINRPNEAFSDFTARVPIRYLAHHSTEVILNQEWSVISQTQVMYANQAKEFITILSGKKKITEFFSLTAGIGYRGYVVNNDAMLAVLSTSYHFMDFGISYDWNISELSNDASQKTSVEFTLAVRTPPPRKLKPILFKKNRPCPVFVDPR